MGVGSEVFRADSSDTLWFRVQGLGFPGLPDSKKTSLNKPYKLRV